MSTASLGYLRYPDSAHYLSRQFQYLWRCKRHICFIAPCLAQHPHRVNEYVNIATLGVTVETIKPLQRNYYFIGVDQRVDRDVGE